MSVQDIEHVLVLSDDIDATREFYCQVIGLHVGDRPPLEFPGYWLYAGTTACLHIAERGPYRAHSARMGLDVAAQAGADGPVDHIAFRASGYEELTARLERHAVPSVRNTVPGGPRQLFVQDPNGVRIELNVHPRD